MGYPLVPRHTRALAYVWYGLVLIGASSSLAKTVSAQWVAPASQSRLRAGHNWEFRDRYAGVDRLLNATSYGRMVVHEALWAGPERSSSALRRYAAVQWRLQNAPPRLAPEEPAVAPGFAKLVPEVVQVLVWGRNFQRQIYDVWADESISERVKDGRITELLEYYRSRPAFALSAQPKRMDVVDGQFYSRAFRDAYPTANGILWASHWLEAGLAEPLVAALDPEERRTLVLAAVRRFDRMTADAPASTPALMPIMPAIAPLFSQRYPAIAAIIDNLHMLNGAIADILVSPAVPRSAKRQEILRAAARFRDDTADVLSYDGWLAAGMASGVHHMGGPVVEMGGGVPMPAGAHGDSVRFVPHAMPVRSDTGRTPRAGGQDAAGGSGHAGHGTPAVGGSPPASAATTEKGEPSQSLQAILDRMLADPVIRERAATDPILQRLLAARPTAGAAMNSMPGMQHGGIAAAPLDLRPSAPLTEERRQAVEFLARLFSDPAVEARIHADPVLHGLWADPDVQQRLADLRRMQAAPPGPGSPAASTRPRPGPPPATAHGAHDSTSRTSRTAPTPPPGTHQHF